MTNFVKEVKNPCVSVCRFKEGLCLGCYRTMYERNYWPSMTEEEKRQTIMTLAIRKRKKPDPAPKVEDNLDEPLPYAWW